MKKYLVMLLLLVAVLALAACNRDTGGDAGTAATPAATPAEAPAPTETPATEDPPPAEGWAWEGEISVAPYMFAPVDTARDIITPALEELIRERLNMNVTLNNVYIEWGNYRELINVRIASGTAPDVFLGAGEVLIHEYYRQSAIASWERSFFEENAPGITAFINGGGTRNAHVERVDQWWYASQLDGSMLSFPRLDSPLFMPPRQGMVYRGDWLDNLGVPHDEIPHQLDEWLELMYRFVNEDPAGDGRNNFAFSTSLVISLFTAHGVFPGFVGANAHWTEVDGRVINNDVHPVNKEVLALLQTLYADGLIDPEFILGENTGGGHWAISHGFINGMYGVTSGGSFDHWRPREVQNDAGGIVAQEWWGVNGPDAEYVFGPWVVGPEGHHGFWVFNGFALHESYVLNAALNNDREKMAAIFQVMDFLASNDDVAMLAFFGVEDVTFQRNADGTAFQHITPEEANAMGVRAMRGLYGPSMPFNAMIQEYGFYRSPSAAFQLKWLARPYHNSRLRNAILTPPPSQGLFIGELNSYRDEIWIQIIRGELPVDYFDDFVEEYMRRGGQVLYDEANAMFSR